MSNQAINDPLFVKKRKTKKGFYDDYAPDWARIREGILEKYNYTCSRCERKDKLAVAHIDQNTHNNDESNLTVFCPKHHIEHDQPYHVFSAQSQKTRQYTDNTYVEEKVILRLKAVKLINKKTINVLECFSGDGLVWSKVKEMLPQIKINILQIDKKGEKTGVYLRGDNVRFIGLFEFENYDIIDLDAYGTPINQLEVIFMRNDFKGVVVFTFIQKLRGRLNNRMLEVIGYPKEMIKKSPLLFCGNGFQKFQQYLSAYGVTKITFYSREQKHYGYFLAPKKKDEKCPKEA